MVLPTGAHTQPGEWFFEKFQWFRFCVGVDHLRERARARPTTWKNWRALVPVAVYFAVPSGINTFPSPVFSSKKKKITARRTRVHANRETPAPDVTMAVSYTHTSMGWARRMHVHSTYSRTYTHTQMMGLMRGRKNIRFVTSFSSVKRHLNKSDRTLKYINFDL